MSVPTFCSAHLLLLCTYHTMLCILLSRVSVLAPVTIIKWLRFQRILEKSSGSKDFLKTAPAPAECNDKLQLRIDLIALNHNFVQYIHSYVQVFPHSVTGAVLQQEMILYAGKLIASYRELFKGILVLRSGILNSYVTLSLTFLSLLTY